jgi:transposase
VTPGAVCQWIKAAEESSLSGLLSSTTKRGTKPRLPLEELERLPEFLNRGPEAYGFRGNVWTRARVRKVIQEEFGVTYSVRHVGRLLRKVGWTRQKPVERADQRDEEEIAGWHAETFPELKKKPLERAEP